jgi:hypothetical protein
VCEALKILRGAGKMAGKAIVHYFSDGEICFWIEQGASIHIKAVAPHGDPVELTTEEAKSIAAKLLECAQQLDALNSN